MKNLNHFILVVLLFLCRSGFACSAFCFAPTHGNDTVLAYSHDFMQIGGYWIASPAGLSKRAIVDNTQPTGAKPKSWSATHPTVTLSPFGIQEPMAGFNESLGIVGLRDTQGQNIPNSDSRDYLNSYEVIQWLLDTAASVQEALQLLTTVRVTHVLANKSGHYMMADSTGARAVFEFQEGKLVIYANIQSKNYGKLDPAVLTNYLYVNNVEGLKTKQSPNPADHRFETIVQKLQSPPAKSSDPLSYALDILESVPYPESDLASVRIVFDFASGQLIFNSDQPKTDPKATAVHDPAYAGVKRIDMKALLHRVIGLQPKTQLMLPVAHTGQGDVTKEFETFKPEKMDPFIEQSVVLRGSQIDHIIDQVKKFGRSCDTMWK